MGKKFEDDSELKKLLEEQMIREAEIIEEAIFSDKDFEDYEMTDEEVEASYQKLMEQINASAEDPAPSAAEEKTIPLSRKKTIRHTGGKLHGIRVAGIAAACIAGVFAASMTSEGNRQYVVDSVKHLFGKDARIVVNNDEDNELPETEEYEAIENIEESLGVDVPQFMYRPNGFRYRSYDVDIKSGNAWIEYEYNNSIIFFEIDQEANDNGSLIDSAHGEEISSENIKIADNINVTIKTIQGKDDLVPNYSAYWRREDAIYQLSGKMEKTHFYMMIEEIVY